MATRTFTYEEATTLLPILESLLKQAMEGKKLVGKIDEEFQQLSHRIFLHGGILVDIVPAARRKAEREKTVQKIKDALAEIEAMGVQVKDLDTGLLDFPCVVDEQTILLCWKYGEKELAFWHGTEEGFAGRKPITEEVRRAKRQKRPN